MKNYTKQQLIEMYLDWINNFIYTPAFSEYYGLSMAETENIIDYGSKLFNEGKNKQQ